MKTKEVIKTIRVERVSLNAARMKKHHTLLPAVYFRAWCDGNFLAEDVDRLTAVGIVAELVQASKTHCLAISVGIDRNAGVEA